MTAPNAPPPASQPDPFRFATTAWSRVLQAATPTDPEARSALAELCRVYWYPLYAYLRRRGADPAVAEDNVQAFFTALLEKNAIRYADPRRGRFRGFLVASLKQFLARQHEHDSAQKRCPPNPVLSIDAETAEARYARELTDDVTPDRLFDYVWAVAVVGQAVHRLRAEYEAGGKTDRFDAFQGVLTGQSTLSAREIGETLGLSEGAVRVAVHRLKQRYAELLREQVGATLGTGEDVEAELRELLAALTLGRAV